MYAPRGNYFFSGHLNVPNAVTLKGVWESVPAHNGERDAHVQNRLMMAQLFWSLKMPEPRTARLSSR